MTHQGKCLIGKDKCHHRRRHPNVCQEISGMAYVLCLLTYVVHLNILIRNVEYCQCFTLKLHLHSMCSLSRQPTLHFHMFTRMFSPCCSPPSTAFHVCAPASHTDQWFCHHHFYPGLLWVGLSVGAGHTQTARTHWTQGPPFPKYLSHLVRPCS